MRQLVWDLKHFKSFLSPKGSYNIFTSWQNVTVNKCQIGNLIFKIYFLPWGCLYSGGSLNSNKNGASEEILQVILQIIQKSYSVQFLHSASVVGRYIGRYFASKYNCSPSITLCEDICHGWPLYFLLLPVNRSSIISAELRLSTTIFIINQS